MANNLTDHLKEVADAIRTKKGTTDLINPQDFAEEIGAISGGGDTPSGGSSWKYYRGATNMGLLPIMGSFLLKYDLGGMIAIVTTSTIVYELGNDMEWAKVKAFAFDPLAKMSDLNNNPSSIITVGKLWEDGLPPGASPEEITEAEFYDLSV